MSLFLAALLATAAANASADVMFEGTVTDGGGTPLTGADLDFFDAETGRKTNPYSPGNENQSEKTDFQGHYGVLVRPNKYNVRYEPPPYRTDLAPTMVYDVVMSSDVTLDVVIPDGVRLTGHVGGPGGVSVPGVDLDLYDAVTGVHAITTKDDTGYDGTYGFSVVPGIYDVVFEPPVELEVAPLRIPNVDVSVDASLDAELPQGFLVTARVEDSGGEAVYRADIDVLQAETGEPFPSPSDKTDLTGAVGLRLPEGLFHILVTPPAGSALAPVAIHDLSVAADVDLGDLALPVGALVTGSVIDPKGDALAEANLDLFLAGTDQPYPAEPLGVTDENGEFSLRVAEGTYDILVKPPPASGLDELRFDSVAVGADTIVQLAYPAEAPELVQVVSVVENPDGDGVAGVQISATPLDSGQSWVVATDSNGAFEAWVRAGFYTVDIDPPAALGLVGTSYNSILLPDQLPSRIVLEREESPPENPPESPPVGDPFAIAFAPNPWRSEARITLHLPSAEEEVLVVVFDVSGRRVATVHEGPVGEGEREFAWRGEGDSGRRIGAGTYILRVRTPAHDVSKKIVRVR